MAASATGLLPIADVLQQIEALVQVLPLCTDTQEAPCREDPTSARGVAIYTQNSDVVCTSDILLPGFNMLPRWLLGGEFGGLRALSFGRGACPSDM